MESVREETPLRSDNEIAALGVPASDLACVVETARQQTLAIRAQLRNRIRRPLRVLIATQGISLKMQFVSRLNANYNNGTSLTFTKLRIRGGLGLRRVDIGDLRNSDLIIVYNDNLKDLDVLLPIQLGRIWTMRRKTARH
jgi:hypothetical protein